MTYYVVGLPYSSELFHFGIKGQKWGLRRFQNPDGTLTPEGKSRYGTVESYNKAKNRSKSVKLAVSIGVASVIAGLAIYGGLKLKNANTSFMDSAFSSGDSLSNLFDKTVSDITDFSSIDDAKTAEKELKCMRDELNRNLR